MIIGIIRFLYYASNELTSIVAVIGAITALWKFWPEQKWKKKAERQPIGFRSSISASEDKLNNKQDKQSQIKLKQYRVVSKLTAIFLGVVISILVLWALVKIACTTIPDFTFMTYKEAQDKGEKAAVNVKLQPGVEISAENKDKVIIKQSMEAHSLVIKPTEVTVYIQENSIQNTTVPNVIGKKYSEAKELLNEKGLHWNPTSLNGAAVVIEESFVSAQSIDSGESVGIGTRIDLVLTPSLQDDPIPIVFDNKIIVPSVVGMGVDEARKTLLDSGFGIVSYSGAIFEDIDGYVIQQSIPANMEVYKGMSIELHVISAKPGTQVTVPNVVGIKQHEAAEMLLRSGLQFQVWWTGDDVENDVYYVVEQSIPYPNSVPAGTVVKLHISSSNP